MRVTRKYNCAWSMCVSIRTSRTSRCDSETRCNSMTIKGGFIKTLSYCTHFITGDLILINSDKNICDKACTVSHYIIIKISIKISIKTFKKFFKNSKEAEAEDEEDMEG